MNIDVPLRIDDRGRTAETSDERHFEHLLMLLLFTSPGERVNRPEFGGGLRSLLFAGNGGELAVALQFNLRANVAHWLGDAIDVTRLEVFPNESSLRVDLEFRHRRTGEERTASFEREV